MPLASSMPAGTSPELPQPWPLSQKLAPGTNLYPATRMLSKSLLSRSDTCPRWVPPVDHTANPVPQSTSKRSALRITREAELLGGELLAYHSRESLVLRAKFLREDLPYFTELLGEIITKTRYASALTRNIYTDVH